MSFGKIKKYFISASVLLCLSVLWISWGAEGHRKLGECSVYSFNQEMSQFQAWVDYLRDHSSDADYRKDTDPDEAPRHYIDIDNYNLFVQTGRIPQTYDSVILLYGFSYVKGNGTLPWATLAAFDSLRECMKRNDWSKARSHAADLSHYVGDGHMPLHITANYNGQQTGNTGIHSRYESTMIGNYVNEINFYGEDAKEISDVNVYVFDYLYKNFTYVDSVLAADNYAKSVSSSTTSSAYKQALWNKSKVFTTDLFRRASHALAELIYTAWVQAGKPSMNASAVDEQEANLPVKLEQNTPNPFKGSTVIRVFIKEKSRVLLQVRSISGYPVATLLNDTIDAGTVQTEWNPGEADAGMYYLVLNTGKSIQIRKMIYVK